MNYKESIRALFEAVVNVEIERLEETKRANKDKMAGALRSRADYIERGDEFDAANNLRNIATGREAGPKGGTGKDSPEAKAKRDSRERLQKGQSSPMDKVAKEREIRYSKPTGANVEQTAAQEEKKRRLRVIARKKAEASGERPPRSTDDGSDARRDAEITNQGVTHRSRYGSYGRRRYRY